MGKSTGRSEGFGEVNTTDPEERPVEPYAPVEGGLTVSGRKAYERELARALRAGGKQPRRLAELPDGEYGFRLRGDDGSEGLGLLGVSEGRLRLDLPLGEAPFARVELPAPVDGLVTLELERTEGEARLRAMVRGELAVRDGFVSLDLTLAGAVETAAVRRPVRVRLKGSAELRFGLA